MVRFPSGEYSVNLVLLLLQKHLTWIFHHAMFDLRFIKAGLHITPQGPVECTKTMMKIVRPDLPSGLGNALKAILDVQIDKKIRHDWAKQDLSERDLEYACDDVLYLHDLLSALRLQMVPGDTHTYELATGVIQAMSQLEIEGYTDLFVYEQDPVEKRNQQREWWNKKFETTFFGLMKKEMENRNE